MDTDRNHDAAVSDADQLADSAATAAPGPNPASGASETPTLSPATSKRDHDDLVLAVALACWYGERGQKRMVIG
jgi:hypothetical protein